MNRWLLLALGLGLGCGGARSWNYDESHRISEVMEHRGEDPGEEALQRSVAGGELAPVAPYTRPVFVRPPRESHRRPMMRGRRAVAEAAARRPDPLAARRKEGRGRDGR